MKPPRKHHYIPQFWLSRWKGEDGRMVRYSRPLPTKWDVRRSHPSEVGWVTNLYRSPEADEARAQWLEHKLFQRIDDMAARVLARIDVADPARLGAEELSAWVMLVRSLLHRTPENLASTKAAAFRIEKHLMAEIRQNYTALRGPGDPTTYEAYEAGIDDDERERSALRMLPSIIMNERIGNFLIGMEWRVFQLDGSCPSLLLSDDPVARTNGIGNPGGHMAMPLSPGRVLVLANSPDTMANVSAMGVRALAGAMNKWVVESARVFVVAIDRSQDRFVFNRFGSDIKASLTANMGKLDDVMTRRTWMGGHPRRGPSPGASIT